MQLSSQQEAIASWVVHGTGSANIVARAGCGKTHTLVHVVIKNIVDRNLGSVALLAYNKAAAVEFTQRLEAIGPQYSDKRTVQAGTFHSIGFSAVRQWSKGVRVNGNKVRDIVANDAEIDGEDSISAIHGQAIAHLVSLAKQSGFGHLVQIADDHAWFQLVEHYGIDEELGDGANHTTLAEVVEAAKQVLSRSIKLDREVIDFDDMILAPLVHNLRVYPRQWVLIDEAQDTNASRRALALKLLAPGGRLVAVGDDRQAIYGFTGADADSLDLIAKEVGAINLGLTVTYRCPQSVVGEANRIVPDLEAHHSAPEGLVRSIKKTTPDQFQNNVPWFVTEKVSKTSAILCRNTKPLIETAYSLLGAGIGCKVEGREIGEGLITLARRWKRVVNLSVLVDNLHKYRDTEVQKLKSKGKETRAQAVEDKVEALIVIATNLINDGKTDVSDLVSWVRELFDNDVKGVVTLATIHKSKGREWDDVYLIERNKTLPSKWAVKDWQKVQEQNLEYVAITRAKKQLVFVD